MNSRRKTVTRPIICTRELQVEGKENRVVAVSIGKPRKAGKQEWVCPYVIEGLGRTNVKYAHGLDSVQSLVMALDGIRSDLEKSGVKLSWAGGEVGDSGFARFVPTFYGLSFSKRIERWIDKEIQRMSGLIEKRNKVSKFTG